MDKENVTPHTHTLFSNKKKEILQFVITQMAQMALGGIMLSEISQTEKGKFCIISLVRGI